MERVPRRSELFTCEYLELLALSKCLLCTKKLQYFYAFGPKPSTISCDPSGLLRRKRAWRKAQVAVCTLLLVGTVGVTSKEQFCSPPFPPRGKLGGKLTAAGGVS